MRNEVLGVVEQEALFRFLVLQVVGPAKVKCAKLLVILHVTVSSKSFLSEVR